MKKVGAFCWLSLAISIVELLICIKFGHGEFNFLVDLCYVFFFVCSSLLLGLKNVLL